MLIYLNRTGFNGLFRLNRRGGFNVPVGRYTNPKICDEETLRAAAAALGRSGVTLKHESFDSAADRAQAGDFVYFDPPYAPLSPTARFTAYTADGFDDGAQQKLQRLMIDLARRGCRVLQSNSTAPAIGRLYRRNEDVKAVGLRALTIPARRAINSRAARRGAIKEFLITNLPARAAARPAGRLAGQPAGGARTAPAAGSGVDSTGTTGLTTFPWRMDMMMRAMSGRHRLMAGVIAAVIGLAVPAFAQSTGMVKGKVTDAKNQPVDGAKVVIEFKEGVTRKFEVKTNKKGEYIQIGLQPGIYQITATKDGVGTGIQETKISIGATQQVDIDAAGRGRRRRVALQGRRSLPQGLHRRHRGQQGRQTRRRHRQVHRSAEGPSRLLRLPVQHWRLADAEAGLRRRPKPRSRPRRSSIRPRPSRTTRWRTCTTRRRSSIRRRR